MLSNPPSARAQVRRAESGRISSERGKIVPSE